jgi:hypothetical protein
MNSLSTTHNAFEDQAPCSSPRPSIAIGALWPRVDSTYAQIDDGEHLVLMRAIHSNRCWVRKNSRAIATTSSNHGSCSSNTEKQASLTYAIPFDSSILNNARARPTVYQGEIGSVKSQCAGAN